MRLGFVANTGFYLRQFRLGVLRALEDEGHSLTLITQAGAAAAQMVAEGFHVEYVQIDSHGSSPIRDLRLVRELTAIYRERQLDLVFHHTIKPNLFGTIAARRLGIPSVAVLSGLGTFADLPWGVTRAAINRLYAWACRTSMEVWFLNDHDRGYFEGRGWLAYAQARTLRTEGVDLAHYAYRSMPERGHSAPMRALFAGRMLTQKGVRDAVAAVRLLHARGTHIELQLLGPVNPDNPDSIPIRELEAWIGEGVVRYLGEAVDVREHLAAADIILQPTKYREGKSRILTEALATGRPIITTPRPGAGELVVEGINGFVVEESQPADIARALERFLALSPLEREQMGVAGRRIAERDHDETYVIEAYRSAVAKYAAETYEVPPAK